MLRFSDHWRGAELFRVVPIESPARLFHGARKAMLLLLCWPLAIALTLLMIVWKGVAGGALPLLPGFIAMPVFALLPGIRHPLVPFSEPPEHIRNFSEGLLRAIIVIVSAGVIATLTSLAAWRGWLGQFIAVELVLVAAVTWTLHRVINRRPWPRAE
jgi:ABC-2 type transport system permease protein